MHRNGSGGAHFSPRGTSSPRRMELLCSRRPPPLRELRLQPGKRGGISFLSARRFQYPTTT